MNSQRKVEIFSAGCSVCDETVSLVNSMACPDCEVSVLDMKKPEVAQRAKTLGISSIPAVLIDGKIAECCSGRGVDAETLRRAGLGQRIS